MKRVLILCLVIISIMSIIGFRTGAVADRLEGAWSVQTKGEERVLVFMDGYFTYTTYNKDKKQFSHSSGGTYISKDNHITVRFEFDTRTKEQVGQTAFYSAAIRGKKLYADITGGTETWSRVDSGGTALAGLWAISARMQDGTLQPIHQRGTRKTVKILSGTRFQWAAIDPGTKEFMGTGGGRYSFDGGKYTEHIEFFSRDSSRVGSSLTFTGSVTNGDWHHSGLSSRGDSIYEVWSRKK